MVTLKICLKGGLRGIGLSAGSSTEIVTRLKRDRSFTDGAKGLVFFRKGKKGFFFNVFMYKYMYIVH